MTGAAGAWGAAGIQTRKILYCEGLSSILVPTYCRLIVPSGLWTTKKCSQTFSDSLLRISVSHFCIGFCLLLLFLSFSLSIGPTHLAQVSLILKNLSLPPSSLLATTEFPPLFQNQIFKVVNSCK